MALALAAIAQVCRALAQQLSAGINAPERSAVRVLLGTPAVAAPGEGDNDHRLNLFFFRFETSGFYADRLPGEPWLLRMHCLVTAFCADESPVPAGENDLRVMGEVLRHFHEHPVGEFNVDGEHYVVQTIFVNLGLEQINQLWSTQGETVYRPSVLYEVSLAPVLPQQRSVAAPLVGSLGLDVRATMAQPVAMSGLVIGSPPVGVLQPSTLAESWTPALCLVVADTCMQSISLQLGSAALGDLALQAWVAGEPGAEVALRWDVWDASAGWQPGLAGDPFAIANRRIDPAALGSAVLTEVELPFTDHAGQAVLYAEREFVRAADGVALSVRSNPVLVTLFEAA